MQFMFSRKSGIVLAALLGVQLILPASGWALTGRDVALKADQVDTSRTSDMSMAMIIKRGDQQLVRFMAMKKKKFPDSEKQHIRFLEPGDIRNTAYLTWSYRDINVGLHARRVAGPPHQRRQQKGLLHAQRLRQ